ncbi:hypothetical protein SAMN04488029_3660 [Reichenbachiella faecimaris]|uniref:Uncharacterized protein n=1 Tax=Reichenbachiella faecimaris TaxID=692418 RepID=A0A1W2GP93_REIFA|nr:hypothetical protein [Reichenbachiella faecimaris]SMD38168.1 hypothetical protein SAMN04488029_3660 [Reichenbachiella faecimaris]
MKKCILSLLVLSIGARGYAQDCLPVKQGQSYKLSSISYDTPVAQDINKWTKTKPAKREGIIAEHNEKVMSGKMKPKYTFDMVYVATEVDNKDGFVHAKMVTTINNIEYESHISCKEDTLYIARRNGFQKSMSPQGKKVGYSLLGVNKLPVAIKIGDQLEPYLDYTWTYPQSDVIDVNVISAKGTSYAGFGTSKSWVQYTPAQVLQTKSFLTLQVNNANAQVTGTIEFVLGKKQYTAYIIESELWTKTFADFDYQSDDNRVAVEKMNRSVQEYWTKKVANRLDKNKLVNDGGYIVSYKTEWFVPELGIVNLIVKSQGFITNETKLVALN